MVIIFDPSGEGISMHPKNEDEIIMKPKNHQNGNARGKIGHSSTVLSMCFFDRRELTY
jgi:hypothetical protein